MTHGKKWLRKGEEIIESFVGYAKEFGGVCLLCSLVLWSVYLTFVTVGRESFQMSTKN